MAEATITQNPTRVTERATVLGKDSKPSLSMELRKTMPLEGTAGASLHRLREDIRGKSKAYAFAVDEGSKLGNYGKAEELLKERDQLELEEKILKQAARMTEHPSGRTQHDSFRDEFTYWNEVSTGDVLGVLRSQIIAGEGSLMARLSKDPNALANEYKDAYPYEPDMKAETALEAARGLEKRLASETQKPK